MRVAASCCGGAEQHRRVAVVAARVHLAVRAACMGKPVSSTIGNASIVRANADAACALARFQRTDHAGFTDAARHLPAPFFEFAGDERRLSAIPRKPVRDGDECDGEYRAGFRWRESDRLVRSTRAVSLIFQETP